ncbi:Fur family transcriptional regulator [Microbacterium arborescens]|jgi:Fur family ferric uptake transcriptional regulator|uniref:Fur family transcriptional regulator n=1 Tax=Microbacterium TaxID=33882 RepID=UPI0025A1144E|nr:Fur family transcriptional regulator [Microbacterium arborescens]MDF2580094.1 transcriptional repressor [Microbacterium sp.]WJM14985.1 Fur family transcriptional regulator [Microbacterium arborescens]
MTIATAPEAIRAFGLRVTESRAAVYAALHARPHASADEVYTAVADRMPQASRQSVYNALNDFADAGLARRIEPAGRSMLFELRVGDNHHHLVCTACGRVEDVDCAVGHTPCLHPSDDHGFEVASAEVTYWGRCAECASSATPAAS